MGDVQVAYVQEFRIPGTGYRILSVGETWILDF